MGKLYIIRHGETDLNKEGVYFGHLNPPLNSKGRMQAEKTKEKIKKIEYDRIISSDLLRTFETAEIINVKKIEIEKTNYLRELNFGIFEGFSYEELKKKYPRELKKSEDWKRYNYETGESVEDLEKRVIKYIERDIDLNSNTILVTHWGVINVILSHYISGSLDSYWKFNLKNGGIAEIEFVDGFPVLKGLNLGDEI